MSEVIRRVLTPVFRRRAADEFRRQEQQIILEHELSKTRENELLLSDLDVQLPLMDLEPYFSGVQKDAEEAQQDLKVQRMNNEMQLDLWRIRLATPGAWMEDASVRAISGYALRFSPRYLKLQEFAVEIDGIGITSSLGYERDVGKGITQPYTSNIPTFYVLLFTPSEQVVDTAEGVEIAGVSPTYIYIGADDVETGLQKIHLSRLLGVDKAEDAMIDAKYEHESNEFQDFMRLASENAMRGYKDMKKHEKKPFVYDMTVDGYLSREQMEWLNKFFGIQRVTNAARKLFRRKKREIKLRENPYRKSSEVFLEENVGIYRSTVDTMLAEFLPTDPRFRYFLDFLSS